MAENLQMRREDLIQMAKMATNQEHLLEGQQEIMNRLDRIDARIRPMENKMLTIGGACSAIVSVGMSLLMAKLKMEV